MPTLTTHIITNLPDYAKVVNDFRVTTKQTPWYRGVGNATYTLTPTVYRHPTTTNVKELVELEFDLLNRFKQRSIPFQSRPLTEDWEHLFFMQHYGVPTRLLDWSENSMVALYFAIASAEEQRDPATRSFTKDAAVWILNPQVWNEHVVGVAWKDRILGVRDAPLDAYKPTDNLRSLNTKPVAISGLHNSSRIVAQRGAFTIWGSDNSPMETVYVNNSFPADALVKIDLPMASLPTLQDSLFKLGYSDSMIYPDLIGLSKELRRQFGFNN
jgi:hypothetical protein